MKIIASFPQQHRHTIEVGYATNDNATLAIRNRYDNENGIFSPHGSSELLIEDLVQMTKIATQLSLIDKASMLTLLSVLTDSIQNHA